MAKVIIVDDHPLFRSGLKQILDEEYDMEVVAEAGNAQQLYRVIKERKWDVIILDINLPGENGLDILKELKYQYKKVSVLFLSNHPESQYGIRALKAGASGYMTKEAAPRELVTALRKIVAGKKYISPMLAEKLADGLDRNERKRDHEVLSDREFQVMCLLGSGKSVKDIAGELLLTVQTVSTYRSRVVEKMGMSSTAEIIRYVIENDLQV
jgi:DNA-binding NarL/FixJ family response regulator